MDGHALSLKRIPKPPPPKELQLHIAVADYLRAYARADWRWTHFPAGELRDARQAAKLKAMGLQRSWPDFILVSPGGRLHALELKRQGETLSEDQEAFAEWCREQGIPFACHDDLLAAIGTLSEWGAVRVRLAPSSASAGGNAAASPAF